MLSIQSINMVSLESVSIALHQCFQDFNIKFGIRQAANQDQLAGQQTFHAKMLNTVAWFDKRGRRTRLSVCYNRFRRADRRSKTDEQRRALMSETDEPRIPAHISRRQREERTKIMRNRGRHKARTLVCHSFSWNSGLKKPPINLLIQVNTETEQ